MRWLILSLALMLGIAQSQDKAPARQRANSATQKTSEEQIGTDKRPLVIEVKPTEVDKKEAESRKAERKDKARSDKDLVYWTRVLAGLALLQILALICQAVFFRSQARSLRETITEMQRATLASQNIAVASQDAANIARQEYVSTHRPRIRIKHVWLDEEIESGKPIMIRLVGVNTGDTSARLTQFGIVTHAVPVSRHPPNDPFSGSLPLHLAADLVSGQTVATEAFAGGTLTLSEIEDIQKR